MQRNRSRFCPHLMGRLDPDPGAPQQRAINFWRFKTIDVMEGAAVTSLVTFSKPGRGAFLKKAGIGGPGCER